MISCEQRVDSLRVSFFNQNGDVTLKEVELDQNQLFEWEESQTGKNITWDNKRLIKKKRKYLSKHRISEIINSLDKEILDEIFAHNSPKKYYLNIQTAIDETNPEYKNQKEPILTITVLNHSNNSLFVLSTKELSKDAIKLIENKINDNFLEFNKKFILNYICFNSEYDMLRSFFGTLLQKVPLLTGWDLIDKDWTYLTLRAKKLGVDITISSITGNLTKLNLPFHRFIVDYKRIFDYLDSSIKIKESLDLNWVSNKVINKSKLKLKTNLKNLYDNNFLDFVLNNATNCILIKLIEDKFNLIDLLLTLANISRVSCYESFSMISMIESNCINQAIKKNKIILPDKNTKKEPYKGGYIMEPKKDLYESIAVVDFKSMYASIITNWNISPDSVLEDDTKIDFINTASGVKFNKEKGIFTLFVEDLLNRRENASLLASEYKSDIENLLKKI